MRHRVLFGSVFSASVFSASIFACVGDSAVVAPLPDSGAAPDTSTATDSGGTPDSSDAATFNGLFVDPTNGSDSNPGTQASPFKTLKHAAGAATSGVTIVLLDGTYSAASGETWTTKIPDGVAVFSKNPHKAVLLGNGDGGMNSVIGLDFAGSGAVADVSLQGFDKAINVPTAQTAVTIGGVTCSNDVVCVSGASGVKLALTNVSVSGGSFGLLLAGAGSSATWTGGTVTGLVKAPGLIPSAALLVQDSTVVADTLVIDKNGYLAAALLGAGDLTLKNTNVTMTEMAGLNNAAIVMLQNGTPKLTLDNTTLDNTGVSGQVSGIVTNTGASVSIKGGAVRNFSGIGLVVNGGAVTADTAAITANAGGGVSMMGGSLQGTNLTITSNQHGVSFQNAGLTLRGTTVSANSGFGVSGSSGTLDLGTTNTPGNNTFKNNPGPGLDVSAMPQNVGYNAVGNTWNPNVQGADASGKYPGNQSAVNSIGSNFKVGPNAKIYL